jgi:hypothetical protein
MNLRKSFLFNLGILFLFIICSDQLVSAQSTIFNIPTTDVVSPKKTYLEFDFISHLDDHEDGGFQTYVPRAVFGLGGNIEAGVNVAFTDALAPDQPVELQPNIKWQFLNDEESGIAAATGAILYAPIANRTGTDSFGFLYALASKKVKHTYGPRFHAGGYGLVDRANGNGSEGGAILGYEQPVHAKVNLVADWFSGKNRFGYVTPGVSIALPRSSLLNIGYSIGNQGRRNNALFVYYGITF